MAIQRYQDINISDNILKKNYSKLYNNGQYQSAYNLLDNSVKLNNKKFIADLINHISNTLYSIQQDYYTNTNDYFNNLTIDFQNVINNYKYIGEWDSSQVYRIYNIVTDSNSNKYYMYINETPMSNISLNNHTYWLEFILKGEKGADGIGVNFIGDWDSSVSYNQFDGVYYNGAIWCCKTANSNKTPSYSSTYWESVVTFLKAKIISGTTEPSDKYNGLIWIEILS